MTATVEGGASATFNVTVKSDDIVSVESVSTSPSSSTLQLGQTMTVKATVSPDNATDTAVEWYSSNDGLLKITSSTPSSCTVKALAAGSATVYAVTEDGGFSASANITVPPASIATAKIAKVAARTYTGRALTPKPKVTLNGKALSAGKDFVYSYAGNVKVGTARVIVKGIGSYTGSVSTTFKINKAKQPLKLKSAKRTIKVAKVRTKAVTVAGATVKKKARGKLTFKKASNTKAIKKFKVNAKTGKITVPKGTKKGTYIVKVKATAKGNANYASGTRSATVKVIVK